MKRTLFLAVLFAIAIAASASNSGFAKFTCNVEESAWPAWPAWPTEKADAKFPAWPVEKAGSKFPAWPAWPTPAWPTPAWPNP